MVWVSSVFIEDTAELNLIPWTSIKGEFQESECRLFNDAISICDHRASVEGELVNDELEFWSKCCGQIGVLSRYFPGFTEENDGSL